MIIDEGVFSLLIMLVAELLTQRQQQHFGPQSSASTTLG
jgi:hypothetical protein